MLNYTRIPAPRVTIVDPQTGIVSNEWFRFFNNLYTIAYAATGSVTPGTYGSATAVPQITVDDFGAILNIVNVPIAIDASQIVSGTIASARISGSYTGITGVGTLTVGTWNASAITTPYGGTGLTSYTAGDTLYYASGTALTKLAIGASTFINTSSGTAPQWTNPSTITIGKATNLVGGAANRIAYQTATDTTGFIVAPTVSNTYLEWSGSAFQWSSNPLGTVTSVSVVSANGLAGTVATATTTPAITLSTTVTGLLKGNGTAISAASSGTDYAPATSGTSILYGNGAGGFSNVTIGTGVSFAAGTLSATGSGGTVTSVAALTLGTTGTDLSSTVANGTTTPVITLNVPTASAANRGALSAADWTTFNSKAPGVTFTTGYVPYGQGTTTLNQSANLTFDGTNLSVAGAVNKVTITSPATGSTLTIADGKTFTASNTLTLAGTDSTTMTFPTTSATIARTDAAQTFTGIQTFGTTASTGNYISVLGSDADNTYLVFSGARKYPRLDLTDTVAGGSTFQFWNLGNQLRFGTNTGSAGTASFYINSGNAGTAVFNGTLTAASFIPTSSTAPTNGMYLPAANTLSFSVNSTRTQTISATGVGIKSTSPQSSLDLGDSTSGFGLTWQGSGGAGGYGSVWTQYGAGNIWMGAGFISNTASNTFISTISTASTYRSGISLDGASNNGIRFFTDGAATIAKGSAYVPTERMRIFSTGGVSIGNTTDPGATNLSVTGGVTANASYSLNLTPTLVAQGGKAFFNTLQTANANARNWAWINSHTAYGDMVLRVSTALGGDPNAAGTTIVSATSTGVTITGTIVSTTTVKTGGYTVATLPAGVVGAKAYVTNALAPAFGAVVVGGGAVTIPVFYNGANWIVG